MRVRTTTTRARRTLLAAIAVLGAASAATASPSQRPTAAAGPGAPASSRLAAQPPIPSAGNQPPSIDAVRIDEPARPARASVPSLPAEFDLRDARVVEGRYVANLEGGARATLTVDPGLESHVEGELRRFAVPYGALVAIDPRDGRVLAFASHSSADPALRDLTRITTPPAASVFKIITAAALVDAGVAPGARVCYGGGLHGITLQDLVDDPARDRSCATLGEAMGSSINAVFAKLADRNLDRPTLERYAQSFGFGQSLPFDAGGPVSGIDVPSDRLEFARTAAGFWHSHLSPLHGALVAATIARSGSMPRTGIVERIVDRDGRVLRTFSPGTHRVVVGRDTAQAVARMMERTVTHGTAHSAFFDDQGVAFLPGIRVAGKTGTLTRERPSYRGYTWFVGFAPADAPTIAVAALVINEPAWRIKASYLAREALRYWLVTRAR